MISSAVLWDFDGTLAWRPGEWRGAVMEVLDEHEPGHRIHVEQVRPYLRRGFPWHSPDRAHLNLSDPEEWWRALARVISRAFEENGFSKERSAELAQFVRRRYVDASRAWRLTDATRLVLDNFTEAGWSQAVLSNHVPELPRLVTGLGIGHYLDAVVTSATLGYEKPHPKAFAAGRSAVDHAEEIWMIGDDPIADVAGAQAAGLHAVLVQHPGRPRVPGAVPLDTVPGLLGLHEHAPSPRT